MEIVSITFLEHLI